MPDDNHDSSEIDLQPVEDDTTQFSDSEQVSVDDINFEFEQSHKLRGILREITIFNGNQCYQKIKLKHRRKYKFRLDLGYLDPRPFRNRSIAWKWLYASLVFWALAIAFVAIGWFDTSSINMMGAFTAIIITAIMTLLAFFYQIGRASCRERV